MLHYYCVFLVRLHGKGMLGLCCATNPIEGEPRAATNGTEDATLQKQKNIVKL